MLKKRGSMEYLLKDFSQSKRAELRGLSLEGALAKMTPKEREIIENLALRISLPVKGLGTLELLSAVGLHLSTGGTW